MELALSFLLLLIRQISSFNSQHNKPRIYGWNRVHDDSYGYSYMPDDLSCNANGSSTVQSPCPEPSTSANCKSMMDCDLDLDYAHKATKIALHAAEVAQASNAAQIAAGNEAGRQAKITLAEKAMDAARSADAKVQVSLAAVKNLAREISEEEALMKQMRAALEASEANLELAEAVAKRNDHQKATMKAQIKEAKTNLEDLDALYEQYESDLEEKQVNLENVKQRLKILSKQVKKVKCEYKEVKEAARQAAAAAKEARRKAVASKSCTAVGHKTAGCFLRYPKMPENTAKAMLDLYRQRRKQERRQLRERSRSIQRSQGGKKQPIWQKWMNNN